MLPKGLLKEYSRAISMIMRAFDIICMLLGGYLAYIVKFDDYILSPPYGYALLMGGVATAFVFPSLNIYASIRGQRFIRHTMTLFEGVVIVALLLTGLTFFTKSGTNFSRAWFLIWILFGSALLIICRCSLLVVLRFMRSKGLNERRVVILGAGQLGVKIANTIQQAHWTGFRIISFFDDTAANKPAYIDQIPLQQTPTNLSQHLSENGIDEVWLALPLGAEARVKSIVHELRHHNINLRFALDIFGLDLLNHSVTEIAGFPVLNISSTPMVGINRLIKALEDRLLAFVILVLISPLLLLIALGVKLTSRGPIFFKQLRLGWDGRIIQIYKFRTMYLHQEQQGVITQATINDKRIVPFGRFLRKTSLDELPQFINVLQGRMSIVGPRPHALEHNDIYKNSIHTYMQRHRVKPGITGWAQVNGWRGETDTLMKMEKRVEYDLYYINNWSFAFDIKIILLTIFRGFINRNAY